MFPWVEIESMFYFYEADEEVKQSFFTKTLTQNNPLKICLKYTWYSLNNRLCSRASCIFSENLMVKFYSQ